MSYPDAALNVETDTRTNRIVPPVDFAVASSDDLARLRAIWAEMDGIPRLVTSRDTGVDVGFLDLDVRNVLRGEESSGRYAFHSIVLPPGAAIPAHGHEHGDTFWFVVDGEIELTIGARTSTLREKGFAFAPELTTQAVVNRSDAPAEFFLGHAPAGADRAFAAAHALSTEHPDSDAAAYWAIFARHGFIFTGGEPLPNDARTNVDAPRIDGRIECLDDYLALRGTWSALAPTPKLVGHPDECRNIPVTDQETRVLLTPEESRAQASVFYGALQNGYGAGPHHQPSEEEFFIVLHGPLRLSVGTLTEDRADKGAFGFAPRYGTHAFVSEVDSEVQLFTMNSPGGHDRGFEVVIRDFGTDRFMPLMEAHGFTFHDAPAAS